MFDAHPVRRDPFAPLLDSGFAALLRRHDQEGLATHAVPTAGAPQPMTVNRFPAVQLVTVDEVFGGWQAAQRKHFHDSGVFDEIYQPGR